MKNLKEKMQNIESRKVVTTVVGFLVLIGLLFTLVYSIMAAFNICADILPTLQVVVEYFWSILLAVSTIGGIVYICIVVFVTLSFIGD